MSNIADTAAAPISSEDSSLDHDRARLSRWGGLLAALTTTDDFDTACREDLDIKQMVDTVQRLEASLRDCAVHGPQQMVAVFIACQLSPAILNRWNSPVLDGLWQAVTGRTPDAITPFVLNPPGTTAELLHRLVWPRAYPPAVDVVLELMGVNQGSSLVLAPAIVTCACAGHVDILIKLLSHPLDDISKNYLVGRLPRIAAGGHLPCCEIIFPRVIPYGFAVSDRPNASDVIGPSGSLCRSLLDLTALSQPTLMKYLLSHYAYAAATIDQAVRLAAKQTPSPAAAATFELLRNLVILHHEDFLPSALMASGGTDDLIAFAATMPEGVRIAVILSYLSTPDCFSFVSAWIHSLHDLPRAAVQPVLDQGLAHAVSRAQPDQIRWFLHRGAHARSGNDYIIYLAAVSGRADVMELLLGAADVDAECAARYRHQMSEQARLLGMAQWLQERSSFSDIRAIWDPHHELELCTALCGGSTSAVEWLLSQPAPARHVLNSAWPLVQAVKSGNVPLVRALLDHRSIIDAPGDGSDEWRSVVAHGLVAARETQNFEMTCLLFPHTLRGQPSSVSVWDIRNAVQATDPFTRQYLFGHLNPVEMARERATIHWEIVGLPSLLEAGITGNVALFHDVWTFVRCVFRSLSELLDMLGPRIDRALQLCTEGDLTPVMAVLIHAWNDIDPCIRYGLCSDYQIMVFAARCGNVPAVRLLLAQGIPARWALPAAVKHGHRKVVSCLIAHGADPVELSSSEQQLLQSLPSS